MTTISTAPLTRSQLRSRIAKLPRLRLAHLPTPLEEMPRLSAELGGPRIFVKREDMTGLAYGGNKARHYEFEMPHIRDEGYDTLINIMDYHSNNARMTAAAANKTGFRYVLVLKNAAHRKVQGNLLIDKLLGAELHLLDQFQSETATEYATKLKKQLASHTCSRSTCSRASSGWLDSWTLGWSCWTRSKNWVSRRCTSSESRAGRCVA
jgi:1-aminocyclopropane-1-carboxylate deaminase/D-cysteine desulfhydrase-like pyridoxal-dependent ACC family enzyme